MEVAPWLSGPSPALTEKRDPGPQHGWVHPESVFITVNQCKYFMVPLGWQVTDEAGLPAVCHGLHYPKPRPEISLSSSMARVSGLFTLNFLKL